jgi:hypothetical protein
MIKHFISVACLTAMLGFSAPAMAQFGDVAKQAGKATVDTTKQVGKKVEEGTKKATTGTKEAITGVPKGSTGRCKDGTYTMAKTRSVACSKHGGVDKWY